MNVECFTLVNIFALLFGLVSTSLGSPGQSSLADEDRQEIGNLAARILKIAMTGSSIFSNTKRNAGTVDTLYNLPDIYGIGRRRR